MDIDPTPPISIVMVHWNAGSRTRDALKRIRDEWDYPRDKLDIVVWDEGAFDGSSAETKAYIEALAATGLKTTYRRSETHPGVTRALNWALAATDAASPYVLRLDNDVELEPDAMRRLVKFLGDHPRVGAVAPRVMYHDNRARLNGGPYWVHPLRGLVMGEGRETVDCDAVLSMVFLVRRAAIEAVGRWYDPALYLFAEEPEFCWQLQRRGYRVFWLAEVVAYHEAGSGTGQTPLLSRYLHTRNDALVMNRITPRWTGWIRNPWRLARIALRCLKEGSRLRLRAYIDGLRARPLGEQWWNRNLRSKEFIFPHS